jgi:hypothetical protein
MNTGFLETILIYTIDLFYSPQWTSQKRYIFTTWKGKVALTVREAAPAMSMVGSQGTRDADAKKQYCGCKKGTCRTNKCVCFVAQRLCGSHCHGGHNPTCQNNMND